MLSGLAVAARVEVLAMGQPYDKRIRLQRGDWVRWFQRFTERSRPGWSSYLPVLWLVYTLVTTMDSSGIGWVMPFDRCRMNGGLTFASRRVQWGLMSRYSICFVFATIAAKNFRLMFIAILSTEPS